MTVKKETLIRTAVLILALVNQILTACGISIIPIDDAQLTEILSLGFTIVASVWAWWKNNSFTKNALEADNYLDQLKDRETINEEE